MERGLTDNSIEKEKGDCGAEESCTADSDEEIGYGVKWLKESGGKVYSCYYSINDTARRKALKKAGLLVQAVSCFLIACMLGDEFNWNSCLIVMFIAGIIIYCAEVTKHLSLEESSWEDGYRVIKPVHLFVKNNKTAIGINNEFVEYIDRSDSIIIDYESRMIMFNLFRRVRNSEMHNDWVDGFSRDQVADYNDVLKLGRHLVTADGIAYKMIVLCMVLPEDSTESLMIQKALEESVGRKLDKTQSNLRHVLGVK